MKLEYIRGSYNSVVVSQHEITPNETNCGDMLTDELPESND